MFNKYKNLIWLILPLILVIGLSALLAISGDVLRSLAAFFCSLWDFTLYIGVATAALGLATGVILVRSPINALFCLIGVFISSIILLLSIRVEFLSMILLIVYIGAIAILFLFVIMLLNLKDPQTANIS
jgi:hypothetical protein